MNSDLKIRESTTRDVLSKKPSFEANEKENTNCGEALPEVQKKTVRFNLKSKADTMNFRRRIKSDCGAITEPQRAPLSDLQLNLPEKNASKTTAEYDNQGKIFRCPCVRPPIRTSNRIMQRTISNAAKVTCKETKQSKSTTQTVLKNEKSKIPSEQVNIKNTQHGITLNKQQKNPVVSEDNKLKSTAVKAKVKQVATNTKIQEKTKITSRLPPPTIFTSTLFMQPLKQLTSSVQVEANKKTFRPRTKSLNINLHINIPPHDAKIFSSNHGDISSPIVSVKPIIQGVMSPIKPNVFTTEQTLLAQCVPKPIAKKETLAHKARNNRRIYEPLVFYDNFYASDYSDDIIAYLLQNERRYMVKKHYLQIYDVNSSNRACIVNWLLQIQGRYKISINAYLLGIRLLDALLAAVPIPKNMYQLISLTLLWIIHKFDSNTRIIEVRNLVSDCYNVYNPQQIVHMEQKVLKFFNFDYNLPEPMSYIFYYAENLNIKSEVLIQNTCYILESYALTEEYSTEPPSLLAAAALHLTTEILFTFSESEIENLWKKLRNRLGYYNINKIKPVKRSMQVQLQKINNAEYEYREVYNKYKVMRWFQGFQKNLLP